MSKIQSIIIQYMIKYKMWPILKRRGITKTHAKVTQMLELADKGFQSIYCNYVHRYEERYGHNK